MCSFPQWSRFSWLTGRNYKEAGRLTKEIASITEERGSLEQQLKERQGIVASDEDTLQTKQKSFSEMQEAFRQEEREHGQ